MSCLFHVCQTIVYQYIYQYIACFWIDFLLNPVWKLPKKNAKDTNNRLSTTFSILFLIYYIRGFLKKWCGWYWLAFIWSVICKIYKFEFKEIIILNWNKVISHSNKWISFDWKFSPYDSISKTLFHLSNLRLRWNCWWTREDGSRVNHFRF